MKEEAALPHIKRIGPLWFCDGFAVSGIEGERRKVTASARRPDDALRAWGFKVAALGFESGAAARTAVMVEVWSRAGGRNA